MTTKRSRRGAAAVEMAVLKSPAKKPDLAWPSSQASAAGHCDQIALMVQHIDDSGFLYVQQQIYAISASQGTIPVSKATIITRKDVFSTVLMLPQPQ